MEGMSQTKEFRLVEADIVQDEEVSYEVKGDLDFVVKQFYSRIDWLEVMETKSKISDLSVQKGVFNGLPAAIVGFKNRDGQIARILYSVEAA